MRNKIFYFIVALVSCNNHQTNKDTFSFYPSPADSTNKIHLQSAVKNARFFNLPVLFKGADSFEIRILHWDVFDLGISLYIVKADSTGWRGYHYDAYTRFHKQDNGSLVSKIDIHKIGDSVFMVKEFVPPGGWKNFADSMSLFRLDTLPTQSLIKNFKPVTSYVDGEGYDIEIATARSYRMLSYRMPQYSSFIECKTISAFLGFFQRQLNKNFDWPDNLPGSKLKIPAVPGF
jgi:hypothetical protein